MAFKHSRMPLIFFLQVHPSVKVDEDVAAKYAIYEAQFDSYGYVTVRIDGVRHKLHRLVLNSPDGIVDHRDGDRVNNLRSNLRLTSQHGNLANSTMKSTNTSGYKGVFWHKRANKWMAQLMYNGRSIYLGLHNTKEEAAMRYNEAAIKFFGEYAKLNEILVE